MSINIVIVGSQTFVGPDGWRLPAGARAWEWWRPRRSWVATAKGKPFLGKPWLLREITGKSQGTPPFFGKHQGNDREISEKHFFWGGKWPGNDRILFFKQMISRTHLQENWLIAQSLKIWVIWRGREHDQQPAEKNRSNMVPSTHGYFMGFHGI